MNVGENLGDGVWTLVKRMPSDDRWALMARVRGGQGPLQGCRDGSPAVCVRRSNWQAPNSRRVRRSGPGTPRVPQGPPNSNNHLDLWSLCLASTENDPPMATPKGVDYGLYSSKRAPPMVLSYIRRYNSAHQELRNIGSAVRLPVQPGLKLDDLLGDVGRTGRGRGVGVDGAEGLLPGGR